jgi:ABC-type uncharacterized transport system auxiliary subunit
MLYPSLQNVPDAGERLPGVVYVRDLEIDRVYDKFKLVIRKSPYVLLYSGSHSWAVRPNRMVSDILAETLSEANVFSGVTRRLAAGRPDYELSGTIRAIEAETGSDPWRARVALDLQLVRFDDGRILWRHEIQDAQPMSDDLDDVPEAVSEILDRNLRRAIDDLMEAADEIRRLPPARGERDRGRRRLEPRDDAPEPPPEEEPSE